MNPTGNYEKYADIINLPHRQSATRPHMPVEDRAAQFSPFAALTGYEDAVKETARLTDERIELDEYSKEVLNQQLNKIKEGLRGRPKNSSDMLWTDSKPQAAITYFVPDERKAGGAYVTIKGVVRKIKEYEQLLVMDDGTEIPIEEITDINMDDIEDGRENGIENGIEN